MRKLLICATAAVLFATVGAHAQAQTPAPTNTAIQDHIATVYMAQTQACIGDNTFALMQRGMRDKPAIIKFVLDQCGHGLYLLLRQRGATSQQAAGYIVWNMIVPSIDVYAAATQ